ncbi:phage protein Gp27 family protein [Rhodanobacter ginsengisoli]|uniref:Phage protein Gp27 family protein n=1 Tax=Rhodanobacter ginsengisoli TaxID=418646 RepID=A0ABW0QNP1_9GAMM
MPRASSIKRLPDEQRRYLEKLIRADRHTLNEILAQVRERFPEAAVPSRSAVGRYSQQVSELAGRMRDIQAASTALVSELGEDPNDRAGQLLVQAVTTLATDAALKAQSGGDDGVSIKQIGELARGAKAVLQARKMSLAERQQIAKEAREALQREQDVNLQEAARAQGLGPEQVEFWRKKVLGIG